jgi:thioredoxin reductase (NADPH)
VKAGQWKVDREPFALETSAPGIFAVGDIRSGSIKRCATAVGEGAMVVRFVHEPFSHDPIVPAVART